MVQMTDEVSPEYQNSRHLNPVKLYICFSMTHDPTLLSQGSGAEKKPWLTHSCSYV